MAVTRTKTLINEPQQQSTPDSPTQPITEPVTTTTTTTPMTTVTMTAEASDYEKTRELRIMENRLRMQKLGIVDLSQQLNKSISAANTPNRRLTPRSQTQRRTPLNGAPSSGPSEPRRRSSRLQNGPPVSYVEVKEDKSKRGRDIVMEEGAKPEFYTEEHDKLLGSTELPWTFGVDGCGADGARVYDPVRGKTCHQCRQKTLGQRTNCCKCNLVQGQFCGDCLYARYGEHVVEANQNPNWVCPPCRGICNCSLCRQAKGWYPTGSMYRKITDLGYKSVAHYLIQTKRAPPEMDADTVSDTQQSAKRALPFEAMEVLPADDYSSADNAGEVAEDEENSDAVEDAAVAEIKSPKPRGRPRKMAKTEESAAENETVNKGNTDIGEKSAMNTGEVVEDEAVAEIKSPKSRGRPRKKPKTEESAEDEAVNKENTDAGEKSELEDAAAAEIKSPKPRGRPRKNLKAEDAAVPAIKTPERRSERCKTENAKMAENVAVGVC